MNIVSLIFCFCVIGMGFIYYWRLSGKEKFPLSFSNFFLGGGQVGALPTHHTNWGLSLAFANAFWYFTYLAYHYGLQVFLYNLPWVAGVAFLGFKLKTYLRASQYGTVHTFLGHCYGDRVRKVASIATVIGYVLNCGFEIFFSSFLISNILGIVDGGVVIAVVLGLFCGLYCMVGGYKANLITDIPQNKLAVVALVLLICLIAIPIYFSNTSVNINNSFLVGPDSPDIDMLIGILVFTSIFNLVDMANWQSIAANANQDLDHLEPSEYKKLQKAFYYSAIKQVVAPGLLGAIVGVMMRDYSALIPDDQLYTQAFTIAFAGWPNYLAGLVTGFILLGFISATLSSADNYILASAQTLVNDLFFHRRYIEIRSVKDELNRIEKEVEFVKKLRRRLPIYAAIIVVIFYYLYKQLPNYVFGFQFIMYGTAICLSPPLFLALRTLRKNPKDFKLILNQYGNFAFWSIFLGILAALLPFVLSSFVFDAVDVNEFLVYFGLPTRSSILLNLAPLFAITISSAVFLFGILIIKNKFKSIPDVV